MAKRFTPVVDPERARCEQNEEDLRKHRQFDTPFALLPKNLNDPKQPKGDLKPLGKQSEDLYLDGNKLWRKKTELFNRQQTWGRETFECANPEETRSEADSKSSTRRRPGEVGWGVRGHRGSNVEDKGTLVMQRGEVDQAMVKNEKGLWVQRKKVEQDDREESPLPEGGWRCPRCRAANERKLNFCEACGIDRSLYEQYKSRPGEDPRLEAAKPRGRGTSDAQAKALQALQARRATDKVAVDRAHRRAASPGAARHGDRQGAGAYVPLNSSAQQVRAQRRTRKYDSWQGVQRTDEDAVRIVGKATGNSNIGRDARDAAKPVRIEDMRASAQARGRKERSPSNCSCRISSPSAGRDGDDSPGASKPFAWQSPSRSRSPARRAAPSPARRAAPSPSPRSKRLGRVAQRAHSVKEESATVQEKPAVEEGVADYF